MADLIAVMVLGVQYSLIILAVEWYLGTKLPPEILIAVFLAYAVAGIAIWHKKKEWQDVATWGRIALGSVILSVVYVGVDSFLGYLDGAKPVFEGGGLLGFPVTVVVCPFLVMISVAGLARALFLSATAGRKRRPS
jgi:hypothetical protein